VIWYTAADRTLLHVSGIRSFIEDKTKLPPKQLTKE